ncbi:MAG: helix-turn-helix transcriptional regulator [bacterium]|nr:helix-turn-helix transcriptional regulator [bacterium]
MSQRVLRHLLTRSCEQVGNLTVDKLAGELDMSRAYMYQVCRNQMEMAPGELIRFTKIAWGAVLLEDNLDMGVVEVSEKIGFSNTAHFREIFKYYAMATPLQYRKLMQKINAGLKKSVPVNVSIPGFLEEEVKQCLLVMKKLMKFYYLALFRINDKINAILEYNGISIKLTVEPPPVVS